MPEKVILFGDGQVASATYWYLTHDSPYEAAAFTVDGAYQAHQQLFGLPVVAFEDIAERFPPDDYRMFISISFQNTNRLRAEKYAQAKALGYQLVNLISSTAIIYPGLEIGDNCLLRPQATIEPFASLGSNVVVGSGTCIGHNTTVGDHSFFSMRVAVAGSVTIGQRCLLGVNSTVRDNVTIADGCIIGAGAVILKDTQPEGVYKAHPAQLLSTPSSGRTRI